MTMKQSTCDSRAAAGDFGMNMPDRRGLSTAPFPSGLLPNAWHVPFQETPAQTDSPEPASSAHVAFSALLVIVSIVLLILAR